jgi:hypothetical protein
MWRSGDLSLDMEQHPVLREVHSTTLDKSEHKAQTSDCRRFPQAAFGIPNVGVVGDN